MAPNQEMYMKRCFTLAKMGGKKVKTNPLVGALLVHNNHIIGEGYHKNYGGPHAEVNCIESVPFELKDRIPDATLYVSLEPCCHEGKTPPCTSLIVSSEIKKVVISCLDPTEKVGGKGVKILQDAGIEVEVGMLSIEGEELIHPFLTQYKFKRPYTILKMVKSHDNYMAIEGVKTWLSNKYVDTLSHKWRSEIDGIMIGTNTAIVDNPSLSTRNYPGDNPIRVIIDLNHRISDKSNIFNDGQKTFYFTSENRELNNNIQVIVLKKHDGLEEVMKICFNLGINILMIEGGPTILKSFISHNLWEEARIITSDKKLGEGIKAPNISGILREKIICKNNIILRITPSDR